MTIVAAIAALLSAIGIGQALAGWRAVVRFARAPAAPVAIRPPITVLKPLHGNEPLLERALASLFHQDYPAYQIVFGVQNPLDPAIAVVERLRSAFPAQDIALVVDSAQHGQNRKVGNLINMLPAAKHDVLAIADSDLHMRPDYLTDLGATLALPGCGLATVLYTGLPATRAVPSLLGATAIAHGFLPGALLARGMGRQDCLGATMCLRRDTLNRIGGFHALVDHLADDNVLGQLVRAQGLDVRLAGTVVATTVPEATFAALFRHELRWARTIRALVPGAFALSVLQYPIFWALIAVFAAPGASGAVALFVLAWLSRAVAATGIDKALAPRLERLAFPAPVGLLPLRELLSVGIMLASYAGKKVDWRGHTMHAAGYDVSSPPSHPS
ncbi:MAG: bacteriohopanetetrol glucosamine biosynthesis glycosyltransferase HpnI [Rhodospirillales bacterium]